MRIVAAIVAALAFTLSRKSPSHTGVLTEAQYRRIFEQSSGIYATTLDYAHRTHEELRRHHPAATTTNFALCRACQRAKAPRRPMKLR